MNQNLYDRLKSILDESEHKYNNASFIEKDPISVPHGFTLKQDVEIMGFFASVFAWGQRATIINKCNELVDRMDNAPFQFITQHQENDLKVMLNFKHRTFNDFDLLYFINFLKRHYSHHDSLEDAFVYDPSSEIEVKKALIYFYESFFDGADDHLRTRKHISTPFKKSACKRLNMFLRWMVRKDSQNVDFGIWNKIEMKNLICPLDVHVDRTARVLGLIKRPQTDWLAAEQLTENLKLFDANDPVKYDFALFGLSIDKG